MNTFPNSATSSTSSVPSSTLGTVDLIVECQAHRGIMESSYSNILIVGKMGATVPPTQLYMGSTASMV